jgi:hypothetical protein
LAGKLSEGQDYTSKKTQEGRERAGEKVKKGGEKVKKGGESLKGEL